MTTLNNLPPDFVATFIRQINSLKFIGIDVFGDKNLSWLEKHRKVIFFGSLLLPMFIGQILYVVWRDKTGASFLEAVAIVPVILVIFQDLAKIIVIAFKQDELGDLIVEIGAVWPRKLEDEAKRSVIRKCTRRLKTFDNAYFAFGIVSLGFFLLFPLVLTIYAFTTDPTNAKYELPMQLYFFCWLDSHYQYAFAFAYLLISCYIIHMCVYISTDFLLVVLTYDISALLSLIHIDLKDIDSYTEVPHSEDYSQIKYVAEIHLKLLRFAKDLDDIFKPAIFVKVSLSSGTICCFCFLAIADEKMLVRGLIDMVAELSAIAILAWPAQVLIDTSVAVSAAAYSCPWYQKSDKFGKYIQLIILRSQRPCHLTVFGFSILSLPMFSKVFSTSWSYLSLLMQIYRKIQA